MDSTQLWVGWELRVCGLPPRWEVGVQWPHPEEKALTEEASVAGLGLRVSGL